MSSFAALLGHTASGFEQSRQQDLQRQFADEQARRNLASEFTDKLILDPNQSDDVRSAALQTKLQLSQLPPTKQMDYKKHMGPLLDIVAKHRAAQQQGGAAAPAGPSPAPAIGQLGMNPVSPNAPALAALPPPPPGGIGPQQAPGVIPPPSAPVATPSQQMMGTGPVGNRANAPMAGMPPGVLSSPPAPAQAGTPSPLLAGIPQIAQGEQQLEAAKSQGQVSGQIAGRQPFLSQIPDLTPTERASLGLGMGAQWLRAANQTVGTGGGYAGELRAQGQPVPANIPDSQWVNLKELGGGRKTFEPGAAPGEKAAGGGTLSNPLEMAKKQAEIRYGYWQKENNTQFGQKLALQDRAFQNSIATGDYRGAKQIVFGADKDYGQAVTRMHTMDENYQSALKGDQQAQLSLLANHLGMTAGAQKGMRIARATMEEAMESAPKTAHIMAKFFHQDEGGNYVFDGWKGGVNLTQDQMKQMVELAHQKVNTLRDTVSDYHDMLRPELGGATQRGVPNAPATPKKKSATSAPPPPPEGTRPPLSSFEH